MRILPFEDVALLTEAVARNKVDFVITNPESYVLLEARYHTTRIATLTRRQGRHVLKEFGGVIVVRADHHELNEFADLRGRTIAAVGPDAFGGFLMQAGELLEHEIDIRRQAKLLWMGLPQDKIVQAVMQGEADAGFVRTGLVEEMQAEGKLAPGKIRILGGRREPEFPLLTSTRLYPEWPIAALAQTPETLSRQVAVALLSLPLDSAPARAGGYHGWTIPLSYGGVHELMRQLRQPPYDRPVEFRLRDVLTRYALPTVLLLAVMMLGLIFAVLRFSRLSRSLALQVAQRQRAEKQLAWENQALEFLARGAPINDFFVALLERGIPESRLAMVIFVLAGGALQPRAAHGLSQPLPARLPWPERASGDLASRLTATLAREDGQAVAVIELKSAHGVPIGLAALLGRQRREATQIELKTLREVALLAELAIEADRAEEDLRLSASVFDNAVEGVIICDPEARILRANGAFLRMMGYSASEVIGQRPSLLRSERQNAAWYQAMWREIESQGRWRGEIWNRCKDGSLLPLMLHISSVRNAAGRLSYYIGIYADISDIKATQAQLERLANYDTLTQLLNRALLMDRIRQALTHARRQGRLLAICLLDLDGFKPVNDLHGHQTGDALLIQVADRLKAAVRAEDTVARLGGDEFVLLLGDLSDSDQARMVIGRLLDRLNEDFIMGEVSVNVSASIGVTLYPIDQGDADALLRHADQAMYHAKRAGRNQLVFHEPET